MARKETDTNINCLSELPAQIDISNAHTIAQVSYTSTARYITKLCLEIRFVASRIQPACRLQLPRTAMVNKPVRSLLVRVIMRSLCLVTTISYHTDRHASAKTDLLSSRPPSGRSSQSGNQGSQRERSVVSFCSSLRCLVQLNQQENVQWTDIHGNADKRAKKRKRWQ